MSSPIEINNIYLGDCLELIQGVPDHSVTAIITDPPYGMGNTSTGMKFSFLDLSLIHISEPTRQYS